MRTYIALMVLLLQALPASAAVVADHESVAEFEQIPMERFDAIRANYALFYGHTSHGSQIMTGLDMLVDEDAALYARPSVHEYGDDLGALGDTSWVQPTRDWLDANPACNVAMWSWCGGCSGNTEEGIATYLAAMSQLEANYPAVHFVYMTGHLDGTGPDGNLYRSNNQIRAYCQAEDKLLFDFAEIESWDPDGNFYPDETDACAWCADWCALHDCPPCDGCAHSHCFNCYRKGKAFWWLMARVDGWMPTGAPPSPPLAPAPWLAQNHPNPFNPQTEILCHLPAAGRATLAIHDVTGQRVALLHDGPLPAGEQRFAWDSCDATGRPMPSGTYLARLRVGAHESAVKLLLLK